MKKKTDDTFLNLIRGITPIKKNNKLEKTIPEVEKKTYKNVASRSTSAFLIKNNLKKIRNTKVFKIEKSEINKKLKKGRIPIDKKIDFHGQSLLEAEILFKNTITDCYKKNLRCILFITGKGILKKNDDDTLVTKLYYGKIRNSFTGWTQKAELRKFILSVEQAGIEYGADGAFFVYLRKQKI